MPKERAMFIALHVSSIKLREQYLARWLADNKNIFEWDERRGDS